MWRTASSITQRTPASTSNFGQGPAHRDGDDNVNAVGIVFQLAWLSNALRQARAPQIVVAILGHTPYDVATSVRDMGGWGAWMAGLGGRRAPPAPVVGLECRRVSGRAPWRLLLPETLALCMQLSQ